MNKCFVYFLFFKHALEQAGMRYGFGRNSMRKIAEDAGAIIKIGKSVRVNFTILDTEHPGQQEI